MIVTSSREVEVSVMNATTAGDEDRRAQGAVAPVPVGRHRVADRVAGYPDVALPPPPPDGTRQPPDRTPQGPGTRRCGAAPEDLVPPEPVHHSIRRWRA